MNYTRFPAGRSIFGVEECAGNVWEWTSSLNRRYPYTLEDGRENLADAADVGRVVRGGAFYINEFGMRCAARYGDFPHFDDGDFGFRVVRSPFSTSGR